MTTGNLWAEHARVSGRWTGPGVFHIMWLWSEVDVWNANLSLLCLILGRQRESERTAEGNFLTITPRAFEGG